MFFATARTMIFDCSAQSQSLVLHTYIYVCTRLASFPLALLLRIIIICT